MKLVVVSDIHGRSDILSHALSLHPDRDGLLFLGDGIRDIDADALRSGGRIFGGVRGNCDSLFLKNFGYEYSEELFLALGEYNVIMMHGHTHGVKSGLERALSYASQRGADALLYGHTHVPLERYFPEGRELGGYILKKPMWVMNPGALADGSYGLLQIRGSQLIISHGSVK